MSLPDRWPKPASHFSPNCANFIRMSRDSAAAAAVAGSSESFRYSVRQLGGALRSGAISASELLDHYLERIQRLNPTLNAFVHIDADGAMEAARASDLRLRAGQPLSALDG